MKISEHFYLSEVEKSLTAERLNINNSLPEEFKQNVIDLAENILEPIREKYNIPFSPSSWFRCEKLNKAIGGSKTSDHMKGMAVDIEIPGIDNRDLAKWIHHNLKYKQLILEFYDPEIRSSGWVHVSYDKYDLKQETLKSYKVNKKTNYVGIIL